MMKLLLLIALTLLGMSNAADSIEELQRNDSRNSEVWTPSLSPRSPDSKSQLPHFSQAAVYQSDVQRPNPLQMVGTEDDKDDHIDYDTAKQVLQAPVNESRQEKIVSLTKLWGSSSEMILDFNEAFSMYPFWVREQLHIDHPDLFDHPGEPVSEDSFEPTFWFGGDSSNAEHGITSGPQSEEDRDISEDQTNSIDSQEQDIAESQDGNFSPTSIVLESFEFAEKKQAGKQAPKLSAIVKSPRRSTRKGKGTHRGRGIHRGRVIQTNDTGLKAEAILEQQIFMGLPSDLSGLRGSY